MGSQSLLLLTSKRAKILECIRLLESRPRLRRGIALDQLIERLGRKADWLEKRLTWNCSNQTRSKHGPPRLEPTMQYERWNCSIARSHISVISVVSLLLGSRFPGCSLR